MKALLSRSFLGLSVFLLFTQQAYGFKTSALKLKDTSGSFGIYLSAGTSFFQPSGVLADRFKRFWGIPMGLTLKDRNNFYYQAEHTVLLGAQVNEPLLFSGITGPSGYILDVNGNPAIIRKYMRGFVTRFEAGKEFYHFGRIKKSSLSAGLGLGFIQHRIALRFDRGNLPQMEGEYADGYDRLTNGFLISQHFTYRYVNPSTISLFASLTMSEGFTKNKRNWNNGADNTIYASRTELFPGLTAGIIIPLKYKKPNQ